jgi:hypothetical protein
MNFMKMTWGLQKNWPKYVHLWPHTEEIKKITQFKLQHYPVNYFYSPSILVTFLGKYCLSFTIKTPQKYEVL